MATKLESKPVVQTLDEMMAALEVERVEKEKALKAEMDKKREDIQNKLFSKDVAKLEELRATIASLTGEIETLEKDLKAKGFKVVASTKVYGSVTPSIEALVKFIGDKEVTQSEIEAYFTSSFHQWKCKDSTKAEIEKNFLVKNERPKKWSLKVQAAA
jgi:phosphoserine phosphatase